MLAALDQVAAAHDTTVAAAALAWVAAAHDTTVAAAALAWVAAQPAVAAPIASARTTQQLDESLPMAELKLSSGELAALREASATERAAAG